MNWLREHQPESGTQTTLFCGKPASATRCILIRSKKPATIADEMKDIIDAPEGRKIYGKWIGIVEPVFRNIRACKKTVLTVPLEQVRTMNSNDPITSIIVTTFNRSAFLKATIDSILAQTYQNFELIIVDDGSTDNTQEIIRSYSDSRIKYIYSSNWGGPAKPRNIGIEKANGMYIAFCDDDDIWMKDKLEKSIEVLKKGSFKIVFSNYRRIDANAKALAHKRWIEISKRIVYPKGIINKKSLFLLLNNFITLSTVVLKENIVTNLRFIENKKFIAAEDHLLWLEINKFHEIFLIDEKLVNYRITRCGISNNPVKRLRLNIKVVKRVAKGGSYPKYAILAAILASILKYLRRYSFV